MLFNAVAEWLFWDEFGARFNFIAVDYLVYTREVLGNIGSRTRSRWSLARCSRRAAASGGCSGARSRVGRAPARAPRRARWSRRRSPCAAAALAPARRPSAGRRGRRTLRERAGGERRCTSCSRRSATTSSTTSRSTSRGRDDEALRRAARAARRRRDARFASDDPRELTREIVQRGPERRLNVVLIVGREPVGRVPRRVRQPRRPHAEPRRAGAARASCSRTSTRPARAPCAGSRRSRSRCRRRPGSRSCGGPDNDDLFSLGSRVPRARLRRRASSTAATATSTT